MTDLAIVPGKPDREIATDLRARTEAALQPILALMAEAADNGFTIQFSCNMDWLTKRASVQAISITKHF